MSHSERRQHPRYPAVYPIEASIETAEGSRIISSGNLHDVSDSGISFVSCNADPLQVGQKIKISILAEIEGSKGYAMQANGEIIWIEHSEFELNRSLIGVHLDEIIESKALASDR